MSVASMPRSPQEAAPRAAAPARLAAAGEVRRAELAVSPAVLKVRANLHGAVEEAVAASREEDIFARFGRYVGGDEIELEISADLAYSRTAINEFVRQVAADLDQEPPDASVDPRADELEVVASRPGRKERDNRGTVEPDQGALDGELRRRPDPRHRRDGLARQRRLKRLRADGDLERRRVV
jgi:hypothetical protein